MNAPLPPDAVAVALLRVTDISASRSNPRKRFDDAYIAELAGGPFGVVCAMEVFTRWRRRHG